MSISTETSRERLARRWSDNVKLLRWKLMRWLFTPVEPQRDVVDDLVGELSLRLCESAEETADLTDDEWKRYAFRQAMRVSRSYCTRLGSCKTRIDVHARRLSVVAVYDDPCENAQEAERASLVRRALEDLGKIDRDAVERTCCDGETYTAVARDHGVTLTSTRRRVGLACKAIGERLSGEFGTPHYQGLSRRGIDAKTVEAIRHRFNQGATAEALSQAFHVSLSVVQGLCSRGKHKRLSLHVEQVRELRERRKNGESIVSLAERFSVSGSTVQFVVHRKGAYANV